MIDPETSAWVAETIRPRTQQCWQNAFKALPHLRKDAVYVEGWLMMQGIPIEHGRCEQDGRIIDPTLYRATWQPGLYIAGVKYDIDEVFNVLLKNGGRLPVVWSTGGFGGFRNPGYRAAYYTALRAAGFTEIDYAA